MEQYMMTKQRFFAGNSQRFFLDDPAAIAAYCREHFPEECAHIIRIADEVSRNYFLFDLSRDMERTWEPVIFDPDGEVDWEYRPGNDPEFTFQFNRHRFFICLGQAYWLTGSEAYAKHFVRLLMSWITNVKKSPETEKTTWRILEAGIRGENWVKAIWYFKDSRWVTDEVVDAFYQCLVEHAEYIIRMHSPYRYISNWGVIENHGLFEIGIAMPDEGLRNRYTRIALEHLETEAQMQIMDDGIHWEQSPLYHNEVLHCYEDVLILAERNDIDVPDAIRDGVYRMAYGNLAWIKPDHRQFLMGDSDDTDIRDYISVAACLYRDPVLKTGGYPLLDFESVWDLGIECARMYEQLEAREPDFTSIALTDSGNYYMRSGWEEHGNLLHFHCGTMGAGHGHSDKLHIDLVIEGEDVLTDSGRYTYVAEGGRFEFKDPPAHNTITVDGQFFTVNADAWECSRLCQPVKEPYKFLDRYEFVQGGHLGYLINGTGDGVFVNRKVIHIKPDFYIIVDEMYACGKHSYQQYWNFSERGVLEAETDEMIAVDEMPAADAMIAADEMPAAGRLTGGEPVHKAVFTGQQAQAVFYYMTPGCRMELQESKIARDYNRYEMRKRICLTREQTGFTSLITVIQGGTIGRQAECEIRKVPVWSALKKIRYPENMAEALKITCRGKEYVIIICHQEVNSPTDLVEADGCMGFGNVIVFEKGVDDLVGTVLQY